MEERRKLFENWVLARGFQDLAQGVRETLEKAHVYLSCIDAQPGVTSLAKITADMAATRVATQRLNFVNLLEAVNAKLTQPLSFDAEFLSLQKARNCLEHRGGRVTEREIDPATGVMTLNFPRLRIFYMRGEEAVELAPGVIIDTQNLGVPVKSGEPVAIYSRRITRSREYRLGDPVEIAPGDFYEIAMACHFFATDLASNSLQEPSRLCRKSRLGVRGARAGSIACATGPASVPSHAGDDPWRGTA